MEEKQRFKATISAVLLTCSASANAGVVGGVFDRDYCGPGLGERWLVLEASPTDTSGSGPHRDGHIGMLFESGMVFQYTANNRLLIEKASDETAATIRRSWSRMSELPCFTRLLEGEVEEIPYRVNITATVSHGKVLADRAHGAGKNWHRHYVWIIHIEFTFGDDSARVFEGGVTDSPPHWSLAKVLSEPVQLDNYVAANFQTVNQRLNSETALSGIWGALFGPRFEELFEALSHNGKIHGTGD
ncbi:MAG: hypothetical protein AAFX44_04840 [Pseudomonadota bacterium]